MAAITDPLDTVANYKEWVHKTDSGDDNEIKTGLVMATQWWSAQAGQFFGVDAAVVPRLFKARYSDKLYLDYEGNCPGIATLTGLEVKVDTDNDGSFADETAWTINVDFRVLPLQAAQGPLPKPWTEIEAIGSKRFSTTALTQVTAKFGWPAVPQFVKDGVKEWLAVWRGESIRTTARVSDLDQVETVSPYHMGQINKLRDISRARVTL